MPASKPSTSTVSRIDTGTYMMSRRQNEDQPQGLDRWLQRASSAAAPVVAASSIAALLQARRRKSSAIVPKPVMPFAGRNMEISKTPTQPALMKTHHSAHPAAEHFRSVNSAKIAFGGIGRKNAGASVRRNPKSDLSALVRGMIALGGRADAILFGVDLKRKAEAASLPLDTARDGVVSLPNPSNIDRLGEVVELIFGKPEEQRPSLLRRAAGVLGAAALVGGAAYGANRLVQGRFGNQGASSWGAAADEAKLRFRSAWGAPKAAITPPVVGAPTSDYVAPGAIVPSNVKPSVGGMASTRKVAVSFKQMPVGKLAADARRIGRSTLQNVVRGPLLPRQRFSAADYLAAVVFLERARNAEGQFGPGTQALSPGAMAAAYPATERPGVSALIASAHRRRQKRDLMAGGIGAAAGAAAAAGAVPAWQYLRQVMGR